MNALAAHTAGHITIEIRKGRLCAPSLPNRSMLPMMVASILFHLILFQMLSNISLNKSSKPEKVHYVELATLPGVTTTAPTAPPQPVAASVETPVIDHASAPTSHPTTEPEESVQSKGPVEEQSPQKAAVADSAESGVNQHQISWASPMPTIQPRLLQQTSLRYTREVWQVANQAVKTGAVIPGHHVFSIVQQNYEPAGSGNLSQQLKNSLTPTLPRPLPGQTGLEIVISGSAGAAQITIYPRFDPPQSKDATS